MKTKLIPFAMTPKGLTTKGKAREIAKAKYELEGIELKKELAKIECDTVEDKAKAETKVELQEGLITQSEADKRDATIDKTPWVDVKKMDVNVDDPKQGYMELDWNDEFDNAEEFVQSERTPRALECNQRLLRAGLPEADELLWLL